MNAHCRFPRFLTRTLPVAAALIALAIGSPAVTANLIVNGDFEAGNVGFGSAYVHDPAAGPVCANCLDAAEYVVTTDASLHHPLALSFGDHTSGSGNFLMANGAPDGRVVWSQTVAGVAMNADFTFTAWAASWLAAGDPSPAHLDFLVNGVSIGTLLAPVAGGVWTPFIASFNSGASASLALSIVDLNTAGGGNDFALDDLSLVPEPATLALLGLGLVGIGFGRRRR